MAYIGNSPANVGNYQQDANGMSVASTGAAENANGGTYLYWAFAETPFKGSSGGR